MKSDEIVARVQELVDEARAVRSEFEGEWKTNIEYLRGKFPRSSSETDSVNVNMFWATMRVVVPAVYFKNPEIIATAMRPQDESLAPVVEGATQFWMDRIGTKRLVQKAIVDANACPWGIAKLGYVTEDREVTVKVSRKDGAIDIYDGSEQVDLTDFALEQKTIPIGKRPILSRISPFVLLFDVAASDPENAEWMAEEIDRRLSSVKTDRKYKNTSKLESSPGSARPSLSIVRRDSREPATATTTGTDVSTGKYVRLIEFWDRAGVVREDGDPRLYVIADGQKELLRDDPWPYKMSGYPYFFLSLGVDVTDTPIPPTPLGTWRPQQDELNGIRTFGLDWIKRAVTKYLVDGNRLGKTSREALERGEALSIILTDGPPEGMVAPMPGAPLNSEVANQEALVKNDIQQISGVADFQRATWAPSGTTATEQKLVNSAVNAQIDWQRDQVADFVTKIATGVKSLLQQFADKPEMIRLTGKTGFVWKNYTAEDIQGEYDISIRAGTQLPPDKALKYKKALDAFNLMAPVAIQTGKINFDELLRSTLKELDIDPDRFLVSKDQNEPPQEAPDEEILMQSGGLAHVGMNDNHMEHMQVHLRGMQAARDAQDRWRHELHLNEHMQALNAQRMSQMLQQMPPGMIGPGGPQEPQGGPMGLQGGMGRAAPQPGFPVAPRQFSEQPGDMTQQARVEGRKF